MILHLHIISYQIKKVKSDVKTYNDKFIYEESDKLRIVNLYNNLTKDIQFINFENKINLDKNVTYYDNLIILYWILYHIVSGNLRSDDNKELSFTNLVTSISKNAKKKESICQ